MIIFKGNQTHAFRDPACIFHNGTYHLFFTVSEKCDGYMYNYVATSQSNDLKQWTQPRLLTEKNYNLNFCSPGNVIKHNDEFVLCFTSYPMPYTYEKCYVADNTARLFTMRTKDFKSYSSPRLLNPKSGTPEAELGRMIDPFILEKDDGYYLFFKQNGVSLSKSNDLENWEFLGSTAGGENACVIKQGDEYLLVHSPKNGISFSKSKDLKVWQEMGTTTLLQREWEWASDRLTAGFVMEAPKPNKYKYILFFHGSDNTYPETHGNATLGMAFTDDFENFYYEL